SLYGPQVSGATYPHFIREQRTRAEVRKRKRTEITPGPGAYNTERGYRACLPRSPRIIIQGMRRPKKHETGPFTIF
ncbi:hypothetical protein N311_08302, partial [Apaloderma vittatum]